MKTTEEKEKNLDGKRYTVISISIKKRKKNLEKISHEMEIDLHYAWKEAISQAKRNFELKDYTIKKKD